MTQPDPDQDPSFSGDTYIVAFCVFLVMLAVLCGGIYLVAGRY